MKKLKPGDKVPIGVMGRLKICTIEQVEDDRCWVYINYTIFRNRTGERERVWGIRRFRLEKGRFIQDEY